MKSTRLSSLFVFVLMFAASSASALVPIPPLLPALPAGKVAAWTTRREALVQQHTAYTEQEEAFYREYGKEIDEKDPRAPAAFARLAELEAESKRINAETRQFRRELKTELQLVESDLTRQIDETREQMRGLGFTQSVEDFERINSESKEAVARLKAQLFARLQDIALAKAEKLTSDAVLGKVRSLEPAAMEKLLAQLQRAGVRNARLEQLVRGFTPTASREVLAGHAQELLEVIGQEQSLWEIGEKLEEGTVEARQEAALTLMSLVLELPFLDELKTVAHAGYNVGEAWFYFAVLSQATNELMATTESRLAAQKRIIKRLEDFTVRRKNLRAEIAQL